MSSRVQQVVADVQAWFHGMRARSIAMPQVSVTPANTSPQPTKPARPAPIAFQFTGASGPKAARAAPVATSAPAEIRTCRSSDIAFRPRTTDRPAASQAAVPPSTLTTLSMPAASIFSQAFWLRPPDLQTKYTGLSLPSPAMSCGVSRSRGTLRAKSTWTSPYSAGVRTSISVSVSPRRRRSASAAGEIVATMESSGRMG